MTFTNIALVAGLHGDEKVGEYVLKKITEKYGKIPGVTYIMAHPEAGKRNVRFLEKDLNRSFPGNAKGVFEERLAAKLHQQLQKYDLVIDIHAARSVMDHCAVVTNINKRVRSALSCLPMENIILMDHATYGKVGMISYVPCGISLEYGHNPSKKYFELAVRDIEQLLINLGKLPGTKHIAHEQYFFKVTGKYEVAESLKTNPALKNFELVKKGQTIGNVKGHIVHSAKNFYPVFLKKNGKDGTLALAAVEKIRINK